MAHYIDYNEPILTEESESNIYKANSSKDFIKYLLTHPENEYCFDVKNLVYAYTNNCGEWKIVDDIIVFKNNKLSIDTLVRKIDSTPWTSDIDGFFINKIDMIVVDSCPTIYKVNKVYYFSETYDQERVHEIEKSRLYQAKSKKNIIRHILKYDNQDDNIIDQENLLRKVCAIFDSWKIVQCLDNSATGSLIDIIRFELNNTVVHEISLEEFLDKIDRTTYKFDHFDVTYCYITKKHLIVVKDEATIH